MIDFIYAGQQLHKAAQAKDSNLVAWVTVSSGNFCPYAMIFIVDNTVILEDKSRKRVYYEGVDLEGEGWEKEWAEAINRTYAALDAYQPEKKEDAE